MRLTHEQEYVDDYKQQQIHASKTVPSNHHVGLAAKGHLVQLKDGCVYRPGLPTVYA